MKKLSLALFALIFGFALSAYAAPLDDVSGFKIDAPNLVKISKDWSFGAEVAKDTYDTDLDDGWFTFAKITYTGSIFDLSKDDQ